MDSLGNIFLTGEFLFEWMRKKQPKLPNSTVLDKLQVDHLKNELRVNDIRIFYHLYKLLFWVAAATMHLHHCNYEPMEMSYTRVESQKMIS